MSQEDKQRLIRSYILNNYENHLKEIFLSVENEYSEWDQVSQAKKQYEILFRESESQCLDINYEYLLIIPLQTDNLLMSMSQQ